MSALLTSDDSRCAAYTPSISRAFFFLGLSLTQERWIGSSSEVEPGESCPSSSTVGLLLNQRSMSFKWWRKG
eukprot:scaffold269351_cov22-Tisochrysis_lutea.AAC.3